MQIGVIIPARGGSKGIPGKNLRPVAGLPLLVHAIRAALGCAQVNRVAVSTDDPLIASTARTAGAEVIDRPADLANDTASSESALIHGLEVWHSQGYHPDRLLFLQCTSPLTRASDLDGLISHALASGADSAFTGVPSHRFLWREGPDGHWSGVNHDKAHRPRRQDRPPEIMENGAAYFFDVPGFLSARHRFFGKTVCWQLPPSHGVEIDEEDDLVLVESVARRLLDHDRRALIPADINAVVFDFDGVFTDNRVHLAQSGEESVVCSRGDGLALSRFLPVFPGKVLVLSSETNPVVLRRCEKLGLPCLHGVAPKVDALRRWLEQNQLDPARVVFLGNDLNDLACLELVGVPVAVADAHPEVLARARVVLTRPGGADAVRELLNLLPCASQHSF